MSTKDQSAAYPASEESNDGSVLPDRFHSLRVHNTLINGASRHFKYVAATVQPWYSGGAGVHFSSMCGL